jgi:aspartate carbamoyltransferase catalytic subunit
MTASAHDPARAAIDAIRARVFAFPKRHFLSAGDLNAPQATDLLDLAEAFVASTARRPRAWICCTAGR